MKFLVKPKNSFRKVYGGCGVRGGSCGRDCVQCNSLACPIR